MKKRVLGCMAALVCMTPVMWAQAGDSSEPGYQRLTQLSLNGSGLMAAVNGKGDIFVWNQLEWQQLEGQLAQVSVGSDQEVWGVNSAQDVWRIHNGVWQKLAGKMREVHVAKGGGAVVGIDLNGKPFWWGGAAWVAYPDSPVLRSIAIGKAGMVAGTGTKDEIYVWRPSKNSWKQIRGRLRKISVGVDGTIGGVNSNNQIFTMPGQDVENEVNGTEANAWVPGETQVKDVEIVSNKVIIAQNFPQDLYVQIPKTEVPTEVPSNPILGESLVVSSPIPIYQPDNTVPLSADFNNVTEFNSTKCVVLDGSASSHCSYSEGNPMSRRPNGVLLHDISASTAAQTVKVSIKLEKNEKYRFPEWYSKTPENYELVTVTEASDVAQTDTSDPSNPYYTVTAVFSKKHTKGEWFAHHVQKPVDSRCELTPAEISAQFLARFARETATCVKGPFRAFPTPSAKPDPTRTVATTAFGTYARQALEPEYATTAYRDIGVEPEVDQEPVACEAYTFRQASNHTWVEFRLPPAGEGRGARVLPGAHTKYVFPACHRVWWDFLSFRCNGETKKWEKIFGNYGADGLCHGAPQPSLHLAYGDR